MANAGSTVTKLLIDDSHLCGGRRLAVSNARKAIENEGRVARIEGLWWQFSLTERSSREPSAVSLLRISRDRDGALEVGGRSWHSRRCASGKTRRGSAG